MHDALGFRNNRTGQNWTLEWYGVDQLFNSTFPHVLDDDSFKLCNQGKHIFIFYLQILTCILKGALCVYNGITNDVWTEYGILEKIGEMSGDTFNKFGD